MKKIGIILSGCGIFDGSEIHESVLTLLAVNKLGASAEIFAPSGPQRHVIDHLRGTEQPGAVRNILEESARIARGNIRDISHLNPDYCDALIFPGGAGIVKNLSTFADQGASMTVRDDISTAVKEMHRMKKPMGFMCLAPLLAAYILGQTENHPHVTLGNDPEMSAAVEKMGGRHIECPADEVITDERNRIVTTPAYMLAESISQAETGITMLVQTIIDMI